MANSVAHPFELPSFVNTNNITNVTAPVIVTELAMFVQNIFAVHQGFTYWALIVACISLFSLSCVASLLIVIVTWYRLRGSALHKFPSQQLGAIFALSLCVMLYTYYCVHMYRLDELLQSMEMKRKVFLGGLTFFPLWLFIYAVVLRITWEHSLRGDRAKRITILGKVAKTALLLISRILVPLIVLASTALPLHFSQAKVDRATKEALTLLTEMEYTLRIWNANITAIVGEPVVRRVEADVISLWHVTADAYDSMQPTYLLWTIYFGMLTLASFAVLFYTVSSSRTAIVRDVGDGPSLRNGVLYPSAFICTGVTGYMLFCTVGLPYYSSHAVVPTFFAVLLAATSVLYLLGGAAFLMAVLIKSKHDMEVLRATVQEQKPDLTARKVEDDTPTTEKTQAEIA